MTPKNTAIVLLGLSLMLLSSCQQKQEQQAIPQQKLSSEASFPGGNQAWSRYITLEIERNIDALSEEKVSGTVTVSFTVDTSGAVINPRIMSCCESNKKNCANPDSKLAQVAVDAIRNGPKWEPAVGVDGKVVKSVKQQPITFKLEQM